MHSEAGAVHRVAQRALPLRKVRHRVRESPCKPEEPSDFPTLWGQGDLSWHSFLTDRWSRYAGKSCEGATINRAVNKQSPAARDRRVMKEDPFVRKIRLDERDDQL